MYHYLIALVGLYFFIIGMKLLIFNALIFTKKAQLIKGVVIQFNKEYIKHRLKTFHAIIEYKVPETCELQTFKSNLGRPTRNLQGKEVELYYYKDKNGKLRVEEKNFHLQYLGPIVFIIVGIVISVVFLYFKPTIN